MSDQPSVSITSDGNKHRLVIDGEDVSRDVTNVEVSISAGGYPKVAVDLIHSHVDLDLTKADVEVNVTAPQRRLLIAAGWTPPEKTERDPDSDTVTLDREGLTEPGILRLAANDLRYNYHLGVYGLPKSLPDTLDALADAMEGDR